MEYTHSRVVGPSEYDSMGLCAELPLRESKYAHLADKGCLRAQKDWETYVGTIGKFTGCMGKYNGIAVAVAECIPERLEIVAYANEFAFLHDDILDRTDRETGDHVNEEMSIGFASVLQPGYTKQLRTGKSQMQAKLMLELISIDRERALVLLKSWEGLVKGESGTQHMAFATIAEYLPHRVVNLGETFWFGIITYGMALTVSAEEAEMCKEVTRPAYVTLALANDYFSWQKEYDDFVANPQSNDIANAIWILMKEHSLDVPGAVQKCLELIKSSCAEYLARKADFERDHSKQASRDVLTYLRALEMSISGNVVWSQYSARYNFSRDFTHQQQKQPFLAQPSEGVNGNGNHSSTPCESTFSGTGDHEEKSLAVQHPVLANGNGTHSLASNEKSLPNTSDHITNGEKTHSDKEALRSIAGGLRVAFTKTLPDLTDKLVKVPFDYVAALPSKGIRSAAIDAFNWWYEVPEDKLSKINEVVNGLHNASLMLDDIEDNSPLRRGSPATHQIFGVAQTTNAANFVFVKTLDIVRNHLDHKCLQIYAEELRRLHMGQSWDLYWTSQVQCPSMAEYLTSIDYKTGGLFAMFCRMMETMSKAAKYDSRPLTQQCMEIIAIRIPTTDHLVILIGRYFQIRDDYQNLISADYTNQKGFCEDLDEGKFSLPLIHCINARPSDILLPCLLQERRVHGKMSSEAKQLVLRQLDQTQSLVYTKGVLDGIFSQILDELERVERDSERENFMFRLVLEKLAVR